LVSTTTILGFYKRFKDFIFSDNWFWPQSMTIQIAMARKAKRNRRAAFLKLPLHQALSEITPIPVQLCKTARESPAPKLCAFIAQLDCQRYSGETGSSCRAFQKPIRFQQIVQQRTQLRRAVIRAGRNSRFEPGRRRARKLVERLLSSARASAGTKFVRERDVVRMSAEMASAPRKWISRDQIRLRLALRRPPRRAAPPRSKSFSSSRSLCVPDARRVSSFEF